MGSVPMIENYFYLNYGTTLRAKMSSVLPKRPTALVSGGEALRLKMFLSKQQLRLPRIFHQLAITAAEAAESRISSQVLLNALEAAMRTLRRPTLPIEFGSSIRAADMGIYGFAIQSLDDSPYERHALAKNQLCSMLHTRSAA
jgi:hypothetical protein